MWITEWYKPVKPVLIATVFVPHWVGNQSKQNTNLRATWGKGSWHCKQHSFLSGKQWRNIDFVVRSSLHDLNRWKLVTNLKKFKSKFHVLINGFHTFPIIIFGRIWFHSKMSLLWWWAPIRKLSLVVLLNLLPVHVHTRMKKKQFKLKLSFWLSFGNKSTCKKVLRKLSQS